LFFAISFVAILWGFETKLLPAKYLSFSVFVAILWGFETFRPRQASTVLDKVCSDPLRVWNYIMFSGSDPFRTVCSDPLRVWNAKFEEYGIRPEFVCSDPLRVWNWTLRVGCRWLFWVCSDPLRVWNVSVPRQNPRVL